MNVIHVTTFIADYLNKKYEINATTFSISRRFTCFNCKVSQVRQIANYDLFHI